MVDHNAKLAERARSELADVTVLENEGSQGLSDARNTGLRAASQPVTAFLDDDAEARPGWLAALIEPYRSPDVVATGGAVLPKWPDTPPRWLPPEFLLGGRVQLSWPTGFGGPCAEPDRGQHEPANRPDPQGRRI